MVHHDTLPHDEEKHIDALCETVLESYKIPKDQYNAYDVKRGLRNLDGSGVLAGLTQISEVHGYIVYEGEKTADHGTLAYRGYDINDLAANCGIDGRYGFEEICFLLLEGRLPTRTELENFCRFMAKCAQLPDDFAEDMILKAPSRDIMNKLARSTLALYSYDDNPDECSVQNIMRQSIHLIARLPVMAAYAYRVKRHYYDGHSLILHQHNPDYSLAENLLQMSRSNKKFTPEEARVLDLALILHAEHGGGNNSAFTCRVLSSSGTDTYSAISGAISALKGPRHGGANAQVVKMMADIKANVQNWTDADEVYEYLTKIIRKEAGNGSGLIYGMGHAVYTLSDPRAAILKQQAKKLCRTEEEAAEYALYNLVEELAPKAIAALKNDNKVVSANVDFYSGFVYRMLNIPEEMFTPIFAIARCAGWSAHRLEEVISGKRVLRPAYKSICRNNKTFIPLDERN
ncbi:MAG: citrate synthase [Ruminococcaceae bacterium]|nr:citrate synthase [Oscillospiraceae bacterium]